MRLYLVSIAVLLLVAAPAGAQESAGAAKVDSPRLEISSEGYAAGWKQFALRIGTSPVIELSSPVLGNPGQCFDAVDTEAARERCWQKVGGRKSLKLSVSLSDAGIDLGREGKQLKPDEDCEAASFCADGTDGKDGKESSNPAAFPWWKLYNQLRDIRAEADETPALYRDSDALMLSLPGDRAVKHLRPMLLANCTYDRASYGSAKAYEKATGEHCRERLFSELVLAVAR